MSDSGKKIQVVHGPNLNLLGEREPETYGSDTLDDINAMLTKLGAEIGVSVSAAQSNSEGELVSIIQSARNDSDGILINPGAYTHTSIAIRDAILSIEIPVVEVHLSNVHKREDFRRHSYLADVVVGQVIGFGKNSYALGLRALAGALDGN